MFLLWATRENENKFVSVFAYWESTGTLMMGEESELRTVPPPSTTITNLLNMLKIMILHLLKKNKTKSFPLVLLTVSSAAEDTPYRSLIFCREGTRQQTQRKQNNSDQRKPARAREYPRSLPRCPLLGRTREGGP